MALLLLPVTSEQDLMDDHCGWILMARRIVVAVIIHSRFFLQRSFCVVRIKCICMYNDHDHDHPWYLAESGSDVCSSAMCILKANL